MPLVTAQKIGGSNPSGITQEVQVAQRLAPHFFRVVLEIWFFTCAIKREKWSLLLFPNFSIKREQIKLA